MMTAYDQAVEIAWNNIKWARKYIDDNIIGPELGKPADILKSGDIVYIRPNEKGQWQLAQLPEVEGALVSLSPDNGSIVALAGGFDFYRSKFNRVAQADRQPGSSFKPFIYSAALNKGYSTASIINDAPVVFDDPELEDAWRPENYSGKVYGPTRLRVALIKSRNLVSIRLLRSIGIHYAIEHISKFGFDPGKLPANLSLALGSPSLTPLELAQGYAVIANGGYAVKPNLITHIDNMHGERILEISPDTVCRDCPEEKPEDNETETVLTELASSLLDTPQDEQDIPGEGSLAGDDMPVQDPMLPARPPEAQRVVPADSTYLLTSMMQDVIRFGTGRRARVLKRNDLAGKTGTTNDQRDAWFAGFNPDYVTIAWVGFDKARPLGNYETGGRAALPMWIDYMREALRGIPSRPLIRPEGLVSVRIDPETGLLAGPSTGNSIFETFRKGNLPRRQNSTATSDNNNQDSPPVEQLF